MSRPLFSLVVTVPDATPFLSAFIASVERQAFGADAVEVVAVDHSGDAAVATLLAEWAARANNVDVVEAAGVGVAAARNRGVATATGEWVGFPRAQDKLSEGYLARLARALGATQPDLIAARKRRWSSDDDRLLQYPLAGMFKQTATVDLTGSPATFHTELDTAFLPLDGLRATGLQFDEAITPNFNGGHLLARYLLSRDAPQVLFVREAEYLFRIRPGWLPIDPTLHDRRRFTDVPERGFLQLLTDAANRPGGIPGWLKSAILYEVSLYLRRDQQVTRAPSVQAGPTADRFRATLAAIADLLGSDSAEGLDFFTPEWRQVLFHGLGGTTSVTPYAIYDRFDKAKQAVRLWFGYTGPEPAWQVLDGDRPLAPLATKVRGVSYFGAPVLHKRIAWVPLGASLQVSVDGRPVPLLPAEPETPGAPDPQPVPLPADAVRQAFAPTPAASDLTAAERWALLRARLPWTRRRYAAAWMVTDRLTDADDNGERLFEYLRAQRPDINAWFVIDPDSPDLPRLAEAFGDRVVGYGTPRWLRLALNTTTLVSSHVTPAILRPPALRRFPHEPWRIAFLQHGVVRDDVSRWFNRQPVDLIVASTPGELASFIDDGTNYELTGKEARLVGLPRFDRLLRLGSQYPPAQQDLVLVTPTWRNDLQVSDSRQGLSRGFLDSPFARSWLGLLADEGFRAAVRAAGKRIAFLPHPNLAAMLETIDLPDDVEVLSHSGQDVQRLIARAALQITDYSSMAFNSAYLDRPVVYFQFDAEDFFSGANNSRPGYFDFARDGFGPVTTTVAETVAATRQLLAGTPQEYLDRIQRTFPVRDGRCCERTVAAIEEMLRRATSGS